MDQKHVDKAILGGAFIISLVLAKLLGFLP